MIALLGNYALALGIACAGCAREQQIAGPNDRPALQASVAAASDSACRVVQVQLLAGAPQVLYPNRATCGAGLTIISGGSPSFIPADSHAVVIPIRVLNRTPDPVLEPIRVIFTPNAVEIVGPGSPGDVTAHGPDSVLAGDKLLWLVGTDHTIAAGDSTGAKQIIIKLDHPTADAKVALGVEAVAQSGFPAVAPDSRPAWFDHDSSWTSNGVLKRILLVEFNPVSVAARKEAVDSVGGTVAGGSVWKPGDMGFYYIRVEGAITLDSLDALAAVLRRQPAIRAVEIKLGRAREGWRRPIDGAEWLATNWKLRPSEADGENWALEAIAAPLAWGCSTGDAQTIVAVLERSFSVDEYSSNLVPGSPQPGRRPGDPDQVAHGTIVSNLLAAKGNDGTGMTGVMWTAGLLAHQLPPEADGEDIAQAILAVARTGVGIINLSMELDTTSDTTLARRRSDFWRRQFKLSLDSLASNPGGRPLLVALAGNKDRDPVLAGMGVALDYPGNVLVVGAARRPDSSGAQRLPGSGIGPVVDIYAPGGDSVYFRSDSFPGATGYASGTSFAAPIAAGIAGLLKSFDPTLSAEQIHDFIAVGADSGRIGIIGHQGKYLANAYEALKAAARRPGAPLCGNRVWPEGGYIRAQRGTTVENLFPTGYPVRDVRVRHGGYRVDLWDPGLFDRRAFVFANGTWSQTNPYDTTAIGYNETVSGAAVSLVGLSHERDSAASLVWFGNAGGIGRWRVKISTVANPNGSYIGPEITRPFTSSGGDSVCVHQRNTQCLKWRYPGSGTNWGAGGAFSPMGDRLIIALSQGSYSTTVGSMGPCPWSGSSDTTITNDTCASNVTYLANTGSSDLLEYLLTTPTVAARDVGGVAVSVWDLAISEDGKEIAAGVGRQPLQTVETPDSLPWLAWKINGSGGAIDCQWLYYNFPKGAPALPSPSPVIPVTFGCEEWAGATFAPRKQNLDRPLPMVP